MERERSTLRVVDRDAQDVRRQKIAGKLHALKAQSQCRREGLRERRLPHSRQVFDQQMTTREQAGERQPYRIGRADDDRFDLGEQARQQIRAGD